jgi:cell division protein FtsL
MTQKKFTYRSFMKSVLIFVMVCILYSCSSRVYHKHTKTHVIEIPQKKVEQPQKKTKGYDFFQYQIYKGDLY